MEDNMIPTEAEDARTSRPGYIVAGVVAAVVAVGLAASTLIVGDAEATSSMTAAAEACSLVDDADPNTPPIPEKDVLGDNGRTITLDTMGEEDYSGHNTIEVFCVLDDLGVSDAVLAQMNSTRALDGTLTGSWENEGVGYEAFWNYHPDSGMNLTVTVD